MSDNETKRADIVKLAWKTGARPSNHPDMWDVWQFDGDSLEAFYLAAFAAGAAAERERTSRLVEDMQNELQALRDRLAKQKVRMWVLKDNPGISTMSEPSEKALWEPLGPIV